MSEHKYDKFTSFSRMPYAYIEVPIAFLSEALPTDADWSNKTDGSQKTIEEYSIWVYKSLDETKAIICLGGTIQSTYRVRKINYDDLQDWETWLNTKGYPINTWLTLQERNELLETADYNNE